MRRVGRAAPGPSLLSMLLKRELAASGLETVSYESGHIDSVDVAVRRAVMTGIDQLNLEANKPNTRFF